MAAPGIALKSTVGILHELQHQLVNNLPEHIPSIGMEKCDDNTLFNGLSTMLRESAASFHGVGEIDNLMRNYCLPVTVKPVAGYSESKSGEKKAAIWGTTAAVDVAEFNSEAFKETQNKFWAECRVAQVKRFVDKSVTEPTTATARERTICQLAEPVRASSAAERSRNRDLDSSGISAPLSGEECLRLLDEAMALQPGVPAHHFLRGQLNLRVLCRADEALRDYDRARSLGGDKYDDSASNVVDKKSRDRNRNRDRDRDRDRDRNRNRNRNRNRDLDRDLDRNLDRGHDDNDFHHYRRRERNRDCRHHNNPHQQEQMQQCHEPSRGKDGAMWQHEPLQQQEQERESVDSRVTQILQVMDRRSQQQQQQEQSTSIVAVDSPNCYRKQHANHSLAVGGDGDYRTRSRQNSHHKPARSNSKHGDSHQHKHKHKNKHKHDKHRKDKEGGNHRNT